MWSGGGWFKSHRGLRFSLYSRGSAQDAEKNRQSLGDVIDITTSFTAKAFSTLVNS